MTVRAISRVTLTVDGCGVAQPPHRLASHPQPGGLVRVVIPDGARDYSQDAIDALVAICACCRVDVVGPARLAQEVSDVLERQLRLRGVVA